MALHIQGIKRAFTFQRDSKDITLNDPNENFTPQEVMSFYANQYPELTTASVSGPELNGNEAVYTFKTHFGEKG